MKKHTLRLTLAAASALSVSIASQLQAAPFVSNGIGGGIWEDPASWLGGVGFPDTFVGDSATITAGDAIVYDDFDADLDGGVTTPATPFTLAMGVGPGGLSVANGNSITIDTGGILTQANLPHEIRIGEGAGGVSGIGTLTIDTGGIFASGSSVGVAVGSDLNDAGLGDGTVDLNDGLFVMQLFGGAGLIPAGPASLGIGIEGSTGAFNIGDGIGAPASATLDLETNSNNMGVGTTNQLGSTAGDGTVTVNADGVLSFSTGDLLFGEAGGTGTLQVDGGTVGNGAVATGDVTFGSNGGTGIFNVTAGLVNTAASLNLGTGAGSTGTANITGGTTIFGNNATPGRTRVGLDGGTGTLNITGAATVFETGQDEGTNTQGLFVGTGAGGSVGTVTVDAGTFTQHGWVEIGSGGGNTGTVNVLNGGEWNHPEFSRDIAVGINGGTGNLNITAGGTANLGWWLNVARGGGSTGNVLVDGAGSVLDNDNSQDIRTNIGENGVGNLTVSNDGLFTAHELFVAREGGSTGVINISTGGVVTSQHWMEVGSRGGNGTINIDGVGSTLLHYDTLASPGENRHAGLGGDNQIGHEGGTGVINITNGGTMNVGWWVNVGRGATSNGTINIDGAGSQLLLDPTSSVTAEGGPRLNIGENGVGVVNMTNGALIQIGAAAPGGAPGGYELFIGRDGGSANGTLNIRSGSEVHANGNWSVLVGEANGAQGTVNIETGGKLLANNWIVIGNNPGTVGTVNIDADPNSLIESGQPLGTSHEGRFITGRLGTATVNQAGGVARADNWFAIGIDNGGTGTYNLNGGKIEVVQTNFGDRQVIVGNNGNGTLNITHGTPAGDTIVGLNPDGTPDATFGTSINYFNVAGDSTGIGTLNIDIGAGNKIVSRELYAGWSSNGTASNGTINLNSGTLQTDGWVELGRGNNGNGGTGTMNVDGPDSRWERGTLAPNTAGDRGVRDMNLGQGEANNLGKGFLNVTNGGTVNHNWWINLARQPLTEGHITVDGAGSAINMVDAHLVGLGGDGNSQLNVGEGGIGSVTITNGGVFNHNMDNGGGEVHIARNAGSTGTMTVDGAGSQFNSKARYFAVANAGTGTLNIVNGGQVNFDSHDEAGNPTGGHFRVGNGSTGVGTLNVGAGSSLMVRGGEFQVGNEGGTGTANIEGTVVSTGYIAIGRAIGGFQITNYATADAVIDGGPELDFSFTANYTTSNTQDNGDGGGPFGLGVQVQGLPGGDNNDFAFVALGNFTVGTTGSYIFGNNTDDGSRLRLSINGGVFTEIITDNVLSGPHTVLSAKQELTAGDTITLEWMWFERGGGAEGETWYTRDGGPNALWEDATQGLTLVGGMYSGTVYKAASQGSNGTVNLMVGGVLQKVAGDGGTLDIGSWNGGNPGVTTTGTLNQTGGTVDNTVADTHIGRDAGVVGNWNISDGTATLARLNVGNDGTGTLNMTGGSIDASSVFVGANGGSTGTLNMEGDSVLTTQFIEAGGGLADFTLTGPPAPAAAEGDPEGGAPPSHPGPIVRARGNEANFIRGFTNSGGHSAVKLKGRYSTIDSNGFDIRIVAATVIDNPNDTTIDGVNGSGEPLGTVLVKEGAGTLTIEGAAGNGFLSIDVEAGTLDFESSQTLDVLRIDPGAIVTLSSLSSPPAPADDGGLAAVSTETYEPGDGAGAESGQFAGGGVQAVPEPGTLSLLTLGLFGLLARRGRGKRQ